MDKNIGKTFICQKEYNIIKDGENYTVKKGSKMKVTGNFHENSFWYRVRLLDHPNADRGFIEKKFIPSKYYKPATRRIKRIGGN